jgi:hypothetical protein
MSAEHSCEVDNAVRVRVWSIGQQCFESGSLQRGQPAFGSDNGIQLNGIQLVTLHATIQRDLTRSGELEECLKPYAMLRAESLPPPAAAGPQLGCSHRCLTLSSDFHRASDVCFDVVHGDARLPVLP